MILLLIQSNIFIGHFFKYEYNIFLQELSLVDLFIFSAEEYVSMLFDVCRLDDGKACVKKLLEVGIYINKYKLHTF